MSIGLGIIGTGAIGNVHADAARRNGVRIAGAWDVLPERALECCQRVGGKGTGDLAELLAMKDVTAVAIAVPNDRHAECAIAALAAGKHVLLEKPMAITVAQCDSVLAAQQRAGTVLQVGFVCRGAPTANAARGMVSEGRLGEVYHLKVALYRRRGIPGLGGWFTQQRHSGGGSLIDLGVHMIDLGLSLVGNPRVERASGQAWSRFGSPIRDYVFEEMWAGPPRLDGVFDVDDGVTALLRLAKGVTMEVNITWAANIVPGSLSDGVRLWGDRGGVAFEVFGKEVRFAGTAAGKLHDETIAVTTADPMTDMWDEQYRLFQRSIAAGRALERSGLEGRTVQCILGAIYESSRLGREVEVPA